MDTVIEYVFNVGDNVNHKKFGKGTVVKVEPRTIDNAPIQPIVEVDFNGTVRTFNGYSLTVNLVQ